MLGDEPLDGVAPACRTAHGRRQASVAAAVKCWVERANEANERVRRGCSGGLSQRDPGRLEPIARSEIVNPVKSRPVHVMATTVVRVHWRSGGSRYRVARYGGGNNTRVMMSRVSVIVTVSLSERRRTEQSDSRYRC
jgi:hypothetical protein